MLINAINSHKLCRENSPAFSNFGFNRTFGFDSTAVEVLRVLCFNRYDKDSPVFTDGGRFTGINLRQKTEVEYAMAYEQSIRRRIGALINPTCSYALDVIRVGDNVEAYKTFSDGLCEEYSGYKHLDAVEAYLKKESKRDIKVMLDSTFNHTVVVVDKWSVGISHLLVSLFPVLLPWLFEGKPVTDDERAMLNALTKEDGAEEYSALLDAFYAKMDFRAQRIRDMLTGFATSAVIDEKNSLERRVSDCDDNIKYFEDQIASYFRTRAEHMEKLNIVLQKLSSKEADGDSEIMDLFLTNRRLNLLAVNGQMVDFEIETDLGNFDGDYYEALRSNKRSFLYDSDLYHSTAQDDALLLLDAIFQHDTCRVYMRSRFRLDFKNGTFSNVQRSFTDELVRRTVPNPHLHHFTCLGNNERNLRRALKDKDYVGAVAQLITVTSNLNLHENINGRHFLNDMFHNTSRTRCVELPDKSRVSINDAISWLKAQKVTA